MVDVSALPHAAQEGIFRGNTPTLISNAEFSGWCILCLEPSTESFCETKAVLVDLTSG